ncbi:hypothetical protein GXP67_08760 [Rhodocytophaga rosea]|uniref:Uncharacterized protein n=1 Tax=Rhodocytophaga rosea TaxID=2704465 RepID=A0A6C0GFY9_9BACT|nr:hypothetical protein [Rhodocytophaga rosea]QHT66744.1 hypothetical protein GXP67_08760 [Rhodocytophaga rosea]
MKTIFTTLLVLIVCLAQAQYKTVLFDYNKSFFNEGNPLPAESFLLLQGEVPSGIHLVSASIFSADGKQLLHKATWKRATGDQGNTFQIPITYKLHSDASYSVRINYYKEMDDQNSEKFREQLYTYLDAYLDQTIAIERNRIRLNEPVARIIDNLNKIVNQSTTYYDNRSNITFPGFSDLVAKSLRNIKNQPLSEGKFSLFKRKEDTDRNLKTEYAQTRIASLKELIKSEAGNLLNTDLLTVFDSKYIAEYSSEKIKKPLTVNVGYGGVYFSGNINKISYDSAPYAGVSFPLGNRAFTSKILSNTSVSVGAFLSNFRNAEGQKITGPIVGIPVYAGLGYPIFEFLRFNAGATLLQNANATDGLNLQQVSIKPFIGISADINLWIGLGKNKKLQ